jgi:hypothetical protein
LTGAGNPLVSRPHLAPIGDPPPRVAVPVRGTSVITGRGRDCRAERVGFASPIGRLSAVLRITDAATGRTATSVVPVELPTRIERDLDDDMPAHEQAIGVTTASSGGALASA